MLTSKIFNAVSIKGSGIIFTVFDTTTDIPGLMFSIDTSRRTITIADDVTLNFGNITFSGDVTITGTFTADLIVANNVDITNDLTVGGKLTVTGMIDPPGMTMNESAANPGVVAGGDGTIWVRNDSPNVLMYTDDTGADFIVNGGAGAGNVTGPAVSTNNAISRFDGISGTLIQNSIITVDDSGDFDKNAIDFLHERWHR